MATDFFDPTYMEKVYAALLSQLQLNVNNNMPAGAGGLTVRNFARTFTPPDNVPEANQPAMYVVPGPVHVDQKEFAMAKWLFTAIVFVYLRADSSVVNPTPLAWTQANYIIWAIMNTLTAPPGPYQKQTLGGLVYHCWIEGEIGVETQSEQVVIGIPIYILAGNLM